MKAATMLPFELWDLTTGNMIGNYTTEVEALDRVRRDLASIGADFVRDYTLLGPDQTGWRHQIAEGEELIQLAKQKVAA